jgi:hypothetical protein
MASKDWKLEYMAGNAYAFISKDKNRGITVYDKEVKWHEKKKIMRKELFASHSQALRYAKDYMKGKLKEVV